MTNCGDKFREISTRRIKPSSPVLRIDAVENLVQNWKFDYEMGEITVYDDGDTQFVLCDEPSHDKYYAALILGKPSVRCRVILSHDPNPKDTLESTKYPDNSLHVTGLDRSTEQVDFLETLNNVLSKRGFKFV